MRKTALASPSEVQDDGVDISGITGAEPTDRSECAKPQDPGPFPKHLLNVPGLVNNVMEYTLETVLQIPAVLALAGAVSLQATPGGS